MSLFRTKLKPFLISEVIGSPIIMCFLKAIQKCKRHDALDDLQRPRKNNFSMILFVQPTLASYVYCRALQVPDLATKGNKFA